MVFLPGPAVFTSGEAEQGVGGACERPRAGCQETNCQGSAGLYQSELHVIYKVLQNPKKQDCANPFIANTKQKKKKRINHDELRPIQPLQKTLALQNLLKFCSSSSSFFFYSLTWPEMSCIFCANTEEPHHVFLSLLVFYHTVTTKAISVIQILRGISFRAITRQFWHPVC